MNEFSHLLARMVILLPAFLAALSFHEFSHALLATFLGDPTPKRMGRVTLNPLAHIDPIGLLFLFVFRIGWAKPVIFDQRNFKHPRLYAIITALAGPFSNFILAVICFYGLAYFPTQLFSTAATVTLIQILRATAYVNIMLGVFNILPIPPLDGSHIITALLMNRYPHIVMFLYRYAIFFLIGLFLLPQTRMILVSLISIVEHYLKMLVI